MPLSLRTRFDSSSLVCLLLLGWRVRIDVILILVLASIVDATVSAGLFVFWHVAVGVLCLRVGCGGVRFVRVLAVLGLALCHFGFAFLVELLEFVLPAFLHHLVFTLFAVGLVGVHSVFVVVAVSLGLGGLAQDELRPVLELAVAEESGAELGGVKDVV